MQVAEFNYHLPPELIAQEPAEPRDAARLLVVDRKKEEFAHRIFWEITDYLVPGDVLVLNKTRVRRARLLGKRESGGKAEVLLLSCLGPENLWEALVKPGRSIRLGSTLQFGEGALEAKVREVLSQGRRVLEFFPPRCTPLLNALGKVPLPPYIKKKEIEEEERYQTVYAKEEGSLAAPTAGLHFTPALLAELAAKGVTLTSVVLHVGVGTFRPVRTEEVEAHRMHPEYYRLEQEAVAVINRAHEEGKRVIAAGTTVVRVLETCAGEEGKVRSGEGWTNLFIYPGYRFRVVDALITNFHLPRSTLLLLVSAFAGKEKIFSAYQVAVENCYRFFSFGDAMLIL